ncbi:hypothetical protein GCM10011611_38220 [Aliidongia dinghuensis]|uniref:Lanthionine synthetase n=1 Tax=Aliidongia dinghuensis TaxID=1867774 RepID=A0A8J2YWG1_9PROT|nr:LanC-like protein [Aliidongia dinghuensis]GGF28509.1 hypothetical protein GCM10011611_38220 [Aliidongia dinghuensis]
MFEPERHVAPAYRAWDAAEARAAIAEIADDALAALDPATLWQTHPQDNVEGGTGSIYFGAAGVIWAIDRLRRVGAIAVDRDLASLVPTVLARNAPWYAQTMYPEHGSLLMGELGIRLVEMRLAPSAALADRIHGLATASNDLPTVELMWGLPGAMLACLHMQGLTGEARFVALFQTQAARLLSELEHTDRGPIWTQHLYGKQQRWLGPVHGFAGHMAPLLRGWAWLVASQRALVGDTAARALAAYAVRSELGANWPHAADQPAKLCQHCHGAAGMVTTFADAPFSAPEFDALLVEGGNLVWHAGPLAKGSNLCHGTGGNGYAFLKLHRRTGDARWLERARAFAMATIDQMREARATYGRGRYSLWTGDPGLALYLWDCITAEPAFPTIDIF